MMRLLAVLILAVAPAASAQSLELSHEDALGTEGAFELRAVEYLLDGRALATQADGAVRGGSGGLRHTLGEGTHRLDVRVVYEGRSQVFSYVEGYRFVMRGRVTFVARPGETVRITSTASARTGVTVQWQQRPVFVLTAEPPDAVLGIEYGPVENVPLAEDAARRVVGEVLAEADRLSPLSREEDAPGTCELEPVFFGFKDTRLSPEAEAVLRRVAACLVQRPRLRVAVEGHTDVRGPESVNASLGQGRAQTVAAYLLALGVRGAQLVLRTQAEEQPPCTDSTPGCFARSRRVVLVTEPSGP